MGEKSIGKAERLLQIEMLLLDHPEGLTQAEIARRTGVNRSSISRSVAELTKQFPIYEEDDGRLVLDRDGYLSHVRLTLHETMALHLATRLLAVWSDKHNPYAASALRKLGESLRRLTPQVAAHMKASADVMDGSLQRRDAAYLRVLETLTRAWSDGLKVNVWHQMDDGSVHEYSFAPYFIEPYLWGHTSHVVGLREPPGKIRTFKLERIQRVELQKHSPFTIPADFDPRQYLADAWGIWGSENPPQTVVLRFHPRVRTRVLETRWHPNETVEEQSDGYVIWRAQVAEPREMLPWIRGWGADCEVLESVALRRSLALEVTRLSEMYVLAATRRTEPAYYAHSRADLPESEWQLLKDHLVATGKLAADLGQAVGIADLARIAGLMHDIGKYSPEFQARLRSSSQPVDHATAGAREIVKIFPAPPDRKLAAELISYCIAGHHTGLPDYGSRGGVEEDGTLLVRREKKPLKDYTAYQKEIDISSLVMSLPRIKPARFRLNDEKLTTYPGFSVSFLTRMLFSVLVDADWLDTERFMDRAAKLRGLHASIGELTEQFHRHLLRFDNPKTPINQRRTETLRTCITRASEKPGYFRLTVPTGGGKTLASMAFALSHARAHNLQRVIYVIPFTSIIEQNAEVFREALGPLGPENVLEHHSDCDWARRSSDDEANQVHEKLKLAAENWDVPIVVTTNVQFFESLFTSKKSQARKLHNVAKSVIVFDEAQMLPLPYLKPCLLVVQEMVNNYGCSAVFCTATQPSLERFFPTDVQFVDLAPNPQTLFDFYRRVQVKNLGKLSDDELIDKVRGQRQVLCIVNTRRHAKGLYDQLNEDGDFHLSTLMCPAHRKEVLKEIRQRLKTGQPCRVISTQVMEAGVDVDFPIGFRALAGLDSIIQAAGRVNREMQQVSGDIYVFTPQTEFIKRTPKFIEQAAAVAESTLRRFADDPSSVAAIEAYYTMLYALHGERSFDDKGVVNHFEKGTGQPDFDFKTAAEKFKLIDESSVTVFIPYDADARRQINSLQYASYPTAILRRLQSYAVNIYEHEFEALQNKGVIQTIADSYYVLDPSRMDDCYHTRTGLAIPERLSGDALFFD